MHNLTEPFLQIQEIAILFNETPIRPLAYVKTAVIHGIRAKSTIEISQRAEAVCGGFSLLSFSLFPCQFGSISQIKLS